MSRSFRRNPDRKPNLKKGYCRHIAKAGETRAASEYVDDTCEMNLLVKYQIYCVMKNGEVKYFASSSRNLESDDEINSNESNLNDSTYG